ncbi:MAG: hypothetical protein K2J39_02900 [Ruminococcus sp.]|nr:hypothetical protein [Ruminococcus sp.]MDE6833186.1 hypothetical protein [Ruminococcus sp.]
MAHTQTKELNKIPIGSMDFYFDEWKGIIPPREELETEDHMIGHTKNGANINYGAEWYVAESDDGKVKKRRIVSENASIEYGNITWNYKTLETNISTARTEEKDGVRITKIGGMQNYNGKLYLIRGVYHDPVDGDIRITGVGVNTGGWEAAFKPDSETIVQSKFELEPKLDNEGTILIYEEEIIEPSTPEAEE